MYIILLYLKSMSAPLRTITHVLLLLSNNKYNTSRSIYGLYQAMHKDLVKMFILLLKKIGYWK